ncbi:RNA-directed DNA polymerase, eukaryota [Tanacetum coccineum]
MVNVYAPQNGHAKSKLWSVLLHLKNAKLGFWICFGDFNVVREESDRIGTQFDPITTYSFNKFIDEVELQEVVMGAINFTRINKKGTKLSKLGRFLISIEATLKPWSKNIRQKSVQESALLTKHLEELDLKAKISVLCESDCNLRCDISKCLFELESKNIKDLQQKSRSQWALDGDVNTAFFHSIIKGKNQSQLVHGIMINRVWEINTCNIKDHPFQVYSDRFLENTPRFYSNKFKSISDLQKCFLERPFEYDEIKKAVWSCGEDKVPGPDGFTFRDRHGAHDHLVAAYFAENAMYDKITFRKRFRAENYSHALFEVYLYNSLLKCTSTIRQLAYDVVLDAREEYLQIGDKTYRDSLNTLCNGVMELYGEEYLRNPTQSMSEYSYAFHEEKHGFSRMTGNINCVWLYL